MNANQPPTKRKLVTKPAGPVDKRRRRRGLTVAVRTAIDAMIFDRCTRAEACDKAGFTERALYLALEKPEVAVYWNRQLQVLRAVERASNIHRLVAIRDAADNMPAVQAVKTLEVLDAEAVARPIGSSETPFLTIRIVNEPAPEAQRVMIDVSPSPTPRPVPEQLEPEPPPAEPFFRPSRRW
jgi:hypothetical protein